MSSQVISAALQYFIIKFFLSVWTKKWQCCKQNPMYGAIMTAFSLHKYSGQRKSRSIDLFDIMPI